MIPDGWLTWLAIKGTWDEDDRHCRFCRLFSYFHRLLIKILSHVFLSASVFTFQFSEIHVLILQSTSIHLLFFAVQFLHLGVCPLSAIICPRSSGPRHSSSILLGLAASSLASYQLSVLFLFHNSSLMVCKA